MTSPPHKPDSGRARLPAKDAAPRISGETYFFRDSGQFDLLRLRLLPELIERRQGTRTLKAWSAGCASGEEVYSIAMVIGELLPRREDWNILIVGSDIDSKALAKAERGRYGSWSFRQAPAALRQRYFHRQGDEWELDASVRRMVSLRRMDLVRDEYPGGDLRDMDLILCRNVFIYLDDATVAAVAGKLSDTLGEGGYLMTGHTELIGHGVRNLGSRLFGEGVVYQHAAAAAPPVQPALPPVHAAAPSPTANVAAAPAMAPSAPSGDDLLDAARRQADRGDYAQAEQTCRQALAAMPLAPRPHFLLAQLAQLGGDFDEAARQLEQTLYLDPGDVAAHLELAALCERTGNATRARMLRKLALDIVRALPADTAIEPYETTSSELAQWLAQ